MQGRCSHRKAIEFTVRLYKNKALIGLAETLNFASTGLFIKTDALLFPKNSLLEIEFISEGFSKVNRIAAIVVHRSFEGIGVKFEQSICHNHTLSSARERNGFFTSQKFSLSKNTSFDVINPSLIHNIRFIHPIQN